MKAKIILLIFGLIIIMSLIFLHFSCEKDENDNQETVCGTTNPLQEIEWLKNLINELENAPTTEIYIYTYKGEKVFAVTTCAICPDGVTQVHDCDSNIICVFGGYAGMNICPDFDTLAVKDSLLWKNF